MQSLSSLLFRRHHLLQRRTLTSSVHQQQVQFGRRKGRRSEPPPHSSLTPRRTIIAAATTASSIGRRRRRRREESSNYTTTTTIATTMSYNHQLQLQLQQQQPPLIIDTVTTTTIAAAEEEEPPILPPPVVSEDKTKTKTTTTTTHHHHHHRKSTTTTLPLVPCTPYYNNPDLVVPLTVDCHSGSIEERDRQLIEAARAVCPPEFWSGSNREEDIEVSVLTGGLSNALFVVTTNNAQKRQQRSTSSSGGGCVKCGEGEDDGDDETESTSSWSTSGGGEEERSTNTVVVPQSVLIRVHFDDDDDDAGDDDDGGALFVNRNTEIRNLCHLSNHSNNLAPALYGRFLNGRVEQFYPNAQTLNPTLMKSDKYWCTIATMMGQIHNERPPTQVLRKDEGDCWNKVDTWFELATRTANSKGEEWECMKLHDKRWEQLDVFGRMKEEWIWLKSQLLLLSSENGSEGDDDDDGDDVVGEEEREIRNMAIQFAREVVFTHMDMQSLNLLRVINEEEEEEDTTATTTTTTTSEQEQLKVIDFEYSGYNPRSADIANTFCECCEMNDLRADFMNQYPTIEEQNSYLRSYINAVVDTKNTTTTGEEGITQRLNNNPRRWDIFLDELRKEVGKHSCLSHMTWSVWSVSQAMLSPIEYDYLEYGLLRWEGYNTFKRWFFFSTPSSSEEESSEVAEVEKEQQQQQQEEETVTTQQKQEAVAHDEDVSVMGGEKHEEHTSSSWTKRKKVWFSSTRLLPYHDTPREKDTQ